MLVIDAPGTAGHLFDRHPASNRDAGTAMITPVIDTPGIAGTLFRAEPDLSCGFDRGQGLCCAVFAIPDHFARNFTAKGLRDESAAAGRW